MGASFPRRCAPRTGLAVWLALCTYVFGFFGGAWHSACESHAICEHGDVVHVDGHHASGADTAHDPDALPRLSEHGRSGEGEEHEHCPVWSPALKPALDAGPWPCVAPLVDAPRLAGCEHTHPEAAFPLILLAPAHSPPAA